MNLLRFFRPAHSALAAGATSVVLGQTPVIDLQPEPITTYTGYEAHFAVHATPTDPPLAYRWYLNGVGVLPGTLTNVFGATNAHLNLTGLTTKNSGGYSVVVSNRSGAVTSAIVNLVVQVPPVPGVRFGEFDSGVTTASIPITYLSQGHETNVTFSVEYANGVLVNPRFVPALAQPLPIPPAGQQFGQAADATLTTRLPDSDAMGQIGIGLKLENGVVYPAGSQLLGQIEWDVVADRSAFEGQLLFTNTPYAAQASQLAPGTNVVLTLAQAPPVLVGAAVVPRLNRQSGLFLQALQISNPGGLPLTNALLTISQLPVDSLNQQITVYNSLSPQGSNTLVRLGQLDPGVTKTFTLEYFVSDHTFWTTNNSLPLLTTSYSLLPTNRIPAGVPITLLNKIRSVDYTHAAFTGIAIDFATLTNRSYYIEYSEQPNFNQTNQVRLVRPPVAGTGSHLQWIDNGPPKTESPPNESTVRFYRVLEVR